jgi:hypothetical protein
MTKPFKIRPAKVNRQVMDHLFEDIIVDVYQMEMSAAQVVKRIQDFIQSEGLPLDYDTDKVLNLTARLADLQLLNQLIQASGLGEFRDKILNNEIDRLFPDHNPHQQAVAKVKTTNDDQERQPS